MFVIYISQIILTINKLYNSKYYLFLNLFNKYAAYEDNLTPKDYLPLQPL